MDTLFLAKINKNRENHAWALLRADHCDLVLAFIETVFRKEGHRQLPFSRALQGLAECIESVNLTSIEKRFEAEPRQMLASWLEKFWFRAEINPDNPADKLISPSEESLKALNWASSLGTEEVVAVRTAFATLNFQLKDFHENLTEDTEKRIARLKAEIKEKELELARYKAGFKKEPMSLNEINEMTHAVKKTALSLFDEFERLSAFAKSYDKKARTQIVEQSASGAAGVEVVLSALRELQETGAWESFQAFFDSLSLSRENRSLNVHLKDLLHHLSARGVPAQDLVSLKSIPSRLNKLSSEASDQMQALRKNLDAFAQTQTDVQFKRSKDAVNEFLKTLLDSKETLDNLPKGVPALEFPYEDCSSPINVVMLKVLHEVKDEQESALDFVEEGVSDATPSDAINAKIVKPSIKNQVYLNIFDFLSDSSRMQGRSRVRLSALCSAYQTCDAPGVEVSNRLFSNAIVYQIVAQEAQHSGGSIPLAEDEADDCTYAAVWGDLNSGTPGENSRFIDAPDCYIHEKILTTKPLLNAVQAWYDKVVRMGQSLTEEEKSFLERASQFLVNAKLITVDESLETQARMFALPRI